MSEFNKRTKKGWTLSGDYLEYRRDGGKMDPERWNERCREIDKKCLVADLAYAIKRNVEDFKENRINYKVFCERSLKLWIEVDRGNVREEIVREVACIRWIQ